ncbi:MAG: Na+:solute symporter [Parabacteroides sp.]|nr:Na+:solute symporter [Parabacteroides sp.]
MKLQMIDILIIALYLLAMVVIGLVLKKRASKNMDAYFLGGKTLPFYMLGLSNASGQFDISGTMWMVTLAFIYGVKSAWVPWLWPVFNQIFLMAYLSVWLRRSNVLTGAEWIQTRFGKDRGARLSHTIVVIYALIGVLGFLSYGFIGVGKFMEIFFPWNVVSAYVPFDIPAEYVPHAYGIFFTAIATFYVMLGGMLSIVWTDVVQFAIMTVAGIIIAVIAMMKVSPETLAAIVPEGWTSLMPSWTLDMDWTGMLASVNDKIAADQYGLFGIFIMMMLFKGVFNSMAGPAPNYDMQKILSCRSGKEAALMSGSVPVILLVPRYLMIMGFTVLALAFFDQLDLTTQTGAIDFELILPNAINQFVPVGVCGLLLAGLLAAFMSTFASTANAAPAYIVNDIYKKYINPSASNRTMIRASHVVTIAVVVLSVVIGFFVESVNSVLQWITSALWGGYIAANLLKWHWWRFNGNGYFWGMITGIAASMVCPFIFDSYTMVDGHFVERVGEYAGCAPLLPLFYFPLLFAISLAGCVAGTYMAPPVDDATLERFYITVRPWGFWKPVHDKVVARYPQVTANTHFKRDMVNVAVGIVWQMCLTVIPMYIVIREGMPLLTSLLILGITTLVLKKNWYDKMCRDEAEYNRLMKEVE